MFVPKTININSIYIAMGYNMINKIVRIINEFNNYLDSFDKDFRFIFYFTIILITLLNILSKVIYTIPPLNYNLKNPLVLNIDAMLYEIYMIWCFYVCSIPLKNSILKRIRL